MKNVRLILIATVVLLSVPVVASLAGGQTEIKAEPTEAFLDVGEQEPIKILINDSPWYGGFANIVQLYQEQTGNKVELDVSPWKGMLQKARDAASGQESPYDIINIDQFDISEFYKAGHFTPFKDIDPSFKLDPQVLTMHDTLFWNSKTNWRDADGELMSFSPNGNVLHIYYRADLYKEAGLSAPKSWDDVIQACEKIADPPDLYGIAIGTERGGRVAVDYTNIMGGFGGSVVRDGRNGDFTVTINSPKNLEALEFYINLLKDYGPPDYGSLGQGDLIQYMSTGRVVHIIAGTASFLGFDDPKESRVVGAVNVASIPNPTGNDESGFLGSWNMGIPQNVPISRKKAALAFAKWFLTYEAQYEYAKGKGIVVRKDVYESDLASQPEYRWFDSYLEQYETAYPYLGYKEGPQVIGVLGTRLNQAVVGELSPAEALNKSAEEIYQIFKESGRNTGMLPLLPE